jgi:LPXTG-motif cell wall-anchored protein
LQTTIPPSGVNTYLILGAVIVIIALLIAFLATRRKH